MTAQPGNLFKIAIQTNSIATLSSITGGSSYTNGTYSGVALTGGTGSGATANITVASGAVTVVTLVNAGSGYSVSDSLSALAANIGGTGSGFHVPVATLSEYTNFLAGRSEDWTLSNTQVDVTNLSSSGWTTLLQGAGTQKMAMTVTGVVMEGTDEGVLATAALANTILPYKFVNGFGDTFTGNFAIPSYKRSGTYNGEEQYSVSFDSSGAISYVAG